MIELQHLSKNFGNFKAVDDLSLSIERGKIFCFLGTNGAGKTTTIRMMTGVLKPSAGRVLIGGYDVAEKPLEAKSLIGVIPDRPHIYGKLTGREFLYFMADIYRVPSGTADRRADELLEFYGLAEWQHDLIDTYSHGMKQRILMCAAQVHAPPVLIVDEPMVGLDPRGAKLLKESFREQARRGMTIFMSTHSLGVAEEVADQLAIIKRGRILAQGNLSEIFSRARSGTAGGNNLESVFLEIIAEGEDDQRLSFS